MSRVLFKLVLVINYDQKLKNFIFYIFATTTEKVILSIFYKIIRITRADSC